MTLSPTTEQTAPAASREQFVTPRVDVRQDPEGFSLAVEMPGVNKEGVEITFEDGRLILVGHRNGTAQIGRPIYSESGGHHYRRVFDLDPSIDPGKISASIEQGLLTVQLPKAESSKPRKIEIV